MNRASAIRDRPGHGTRKGNRRGIIKDDPGFQALDGPGDVEGFLRVSAGLDSEGTEVRAGSAVAGPGGSISLTTRDSSETIQHEPDGPAAPRRILAEITGKNDQSRGPRADGAERRKHGRRLAGISELAGWAERNRRKIDPARAEELIGRIDTAGGEHQIIFDEAAGKVYKLTKAGFAGVQAEDAGAYLERWSLHNEVFGDDVRIEGVTTLAQEHAPRIVISQPMRCGRDATPAELSEYPSSRGFYKEGDRWVHPVRGIAVWDTITSGNAIPLPMDITSKVESALAHLIGGEAELFEYMGFGSVWRLWIRQPGIPDDEEDRWCLSFGGCEEIMGRKSWIFQDFKLRALPDRKLILEDVENGFKVVCDGVYLIREDEFLQDGVESDV